MNNLLKPLLLLLYLCYIQIAVLAQKKVVDQEVYGKWASLNYGSTKISNDGKYLTYIVDNQPVGGATTVLQSLDKKWKKEIIGSVRCQFTQDSHQYLYSKNDSITIGALGSHDIQSITGTIISLIPKGKKDDYLIYRRKSNPKSLFIMDMHTGSNKELESVGGFWPGQSDDSLIFLISGSNQSQLSSIELTSFKTNVIWDGEFEGRPVSNADHSVFAFMGKGKDNPRKSIFYRRKGQSTTEQFQIDKQTQFQGYELSGIDVVSADGRYIFFSVNRKALTSAPLVNSAVSVDIYSYKDTRLQSEQLVRLPRQERFKAVLDLAGNRSMLIEKDGIRITSELAGLDCSPGYILVNQNRNDPSGAGNDEWNWNPRQTLSTFLYSLGDGTLEKISNDLVNRNSKIRFFLSPDGRFVLYYDPDKSNYFSYGIKNKELKNLTSNLKTEWTSDSERNDMAEGKYNTAGVAGFLADWKNAIIYDRRDIYQIDMSGEKPPICLTNYYGRKHNIKLRLTENYAANLPNPNIQDEKQLVSGFNEDNKDDGFLNIILGIQKDPELLTMQAAVLGGTNEYETGLYPPIKARDQNIYIVLHQTAKEAPNLFYTKDFTSYRLLTDVQPQVNNNWLNSQLITWTTFNGTKSQGILYTPENLDPNKKYPVIFLYYQRLSHMLNRFLMPEANGAEIDIPTFVSNGYLVFVPDIHYEISNPGKSAFNSVVSAARYLSGLSFVDSLNMGINGHSFGGYETNYIVSHTNLFKAACAGSGWSDFVSTYNGLRSDGNSRQYYYEMYRERMGATLWEKPQSYIDASPILQADQITTPLLMMNNKNDPDVSFYYGSELFVALRRLQKKAWMLQYDNGTHMAKDQDAVDFQIRMQQFFDHYLKGAPPPMWMTKGIPATMKGKASGLELDTSGAIP